MFDLVSKLRIPGSASKIGQMAENHHWAHRRLFENRGETTSDSRQCMKPNKKPHLFGRLRNFVQTVFRQKKKKCTFLKKMYFQSKPTKKSHSLWYLFTTEVRAPLQTLVMLHIE